MPNFVLFYLLFYFLLVCAFVCPAPHQPKEGIRQICCTVLFVCLPVGRIMRVGGARGCIARADQKVDCGRSRPPVARIPCLGDEPHVLVLSHNRFRQRSHILTRPQDARLRDVRHDRGNKDGGENGDDAQDDGHLDKRKRAAMTPGRCSQVGCRSEHVGQLSFLSTQEYVSAAWLKRDYQSVGASRFSAPTLRLSNVCAKNGFTEQQEALYKGVM